MAKQLRLAPSDSKSRWRQKTLRARHPRLLAFYRSASRLSTARLDPETEIELERADGARLRLRSGNATRSLAALAGPSGGPLMLQRAPQSRIFLATRTGRFQKSIDSLAAVCRQVLGQQPLSGVVFVFRNRSATALKTSLRRTGMLVV